MSIEEQIDNAIRDCAVGPDAMRWSPEPAKERGGVWIAPAGTRPGDSGWVDVTPYTVDETQWQGAAEPGITINFDNSQGRFEPGGPIAFATDAPILRWSLAPDEVELLASIRRDQVWWRRLWRRFRRSGS